MVLDRTRYKELQTSSGHKYRYYTSIATTGKTILFIHGFPYTANIWRSHVAFFEKLGYGCIVPDTLGHGGSDKPYNPQDYCARTSAESMVDILNNEGVEQAIVIGHDWGSLIASRFALFFSERTLALVLVAVAYFPPALFDLDTVNSQTEQAFGYAIYGYWHVLMNEKNLIREHTESLFTLFYAKNPALWKNNFMGMGALRASLISDKLFEIGEYVTDIERQEFFSNDWDAATQYYHCVAENHNWSCEKDLPDKQTLITVPSLMVAASDDACAPVPLVQSTLEKFSDVKLVILEGGHHIFLSNFDEFTKEVAKFLTENEI